MDDANKNNWVPGVKFKVKALDDKAQPATGQSNATAFTGQSDVVGAVGPLNSGVALSMQKVFASANMVEISPSNTDPSLTQGKDWATSKTRPYKTYFRTATTDALQGGFAADYAYNGLKKKKAYVVDDKQTYGSRPGRDLQQRLQEARRHHRRHRPRQHRRHRLQLARHQDQELRRRPGLLRRPVRRVGEDHQAAQGPCGVKIPLFGGDGMYATTYIQTASARRPEGDLATSVGVPVDTLPAAKAFISTYKAKGYKGDYGAYGGYSYDAASAIIKAVKAVKDANDGKLPDSNDLRSKVVDAVQKSDFEGITGKVSFDEYGDTGNKQLTVYQVTNGAWKAVKTGTFTG